MQVIRCVSVAIVKLLVKVLLKVKVVGLERIPVKGPVIIAINHVNFIDAPLLYTLMPRETIGLVKVELWNNPLLKFVARSWGAIPIRRGEHDLTALRLALQVLRQGKVLGIAPEGTRSHHGRLQRGRSGVVFLALRVPEALIVPTALFGHEHFTRNLQRFHRTQINIVFGHGFYLRPGDKKVTHEMREKMNDEIMMQIAALLPPEYRGVYHNLAAATEQFLYFPSGAISNVRLALHGCGVSLTSNGGVNASYCR